MKLSRLSVWVEGEIMTCECDGGGPLGPVEAEADWTAAVLTCHIIVY